MITIIFAPPRYGKTALMSHILNTYMYDYERTKKMQNAIAELNSQGYHFDVPDNCVSANYDINGYKFMYSPKKNRRINPFRLGYANDNVDVHVNMPYEVIGIQEAQKYLNSRRSANFPDWQSRWYEQDGHIGLDIFMDTQRPSLIDVNVRELAKFIEVVTMTVKKDGYGRVCKVVWQVREFDNNGLLERYLESGKRNKELYTARRIVADYDVFSIYDTHNCKDKFYKGHVNHKFKTEDNLEDDMPENFYKKLDSNKKEKKVA